MHLYYLRSPFPYIKKDQGYGYPIHTLKFLNPSSRTREQTMEPKILSSDKRIIKIWDPRNGDPWTSVEPAVDINCVAWCQDSGMILTANEGRQQHAFFIPQLGPAPKWCSFLDNLVEEMAEDPNDPQAFTGNQATSVYDNYKFLTVPQLRTLNLDHLIGRTNLLRPYMHGYFVAQRLYEEARLITNPYIWEEERAKRVKEKIDKERESRIRGKKKAAVKVNRKLAEKLLEKQEKAERRNAKRVLDQGGDEKMEDAPATDTTASDKGLLGDSRFKQMFEDEEFAVDETSYEYMMLNPSSNKTNNNTGERAERKERGLTAVEQEAADDTPGSSSDDDDDDDDNDSDNQKRPIRTKNQQSTEDISYKRSRKPYTKMQVSSSSSTTRSGPAARDRSFESRAQKMRNTTKDRTARRSGAVGEKEVTFTPHSAKANNNNNKSRSEPARVVDDYRSKARRSASGNTFRRM
jgi:ribosome biogenesis protein ENP2